MQARQQIDTVLKYLYHKKDEARAITIESIENEKDLLEMAGNKSELERMILKLRDDKYFQIYPDYPRFADDKQDMSKGLFNYCSITFDGRLFWEDGGYTKQAEANAASDKITNRRENHLVYGTWAVGVGAVALVVWEIVKTFWIEPCH